MQDYVGWERGTVESHKNGERGCCELGFCVSFPVFEECEQSHFAPYLGIIFENQQGEYMVHNKSKPESLKGPFNTIYAGFHVQPTPPALYFVVSTQVE